MLGGEEFSAYFSQIREYLSGFLDKFTEPFVKDHILKMVDEGCTGGKQARGKLANSVFLELTGTKPDSEEATIGKTIGWSIELIQASYLMADDLMDQSKTRRGKECWYLHEGVGDQAVNDALILENLAMILLDRLKSQLPLTVLMELMTAVRNINTSTTMGQTLDYLAKTKDFTTYKAIVDHKTSYYSVHLPIVLGMIASQKFTYQEASKAMESFSLEYGFLFQAQDDWIDVFGDPSLTGKVGTDINEGKITWLVCKAYELANDEQKKVLDECYGQKDKQDKVLEVYKQLNINEAFKKFQEQQETAVQELINKFDSSKYPIKSLQSLLDQTKNRKF